jgi:hypothetical protein
LSGYNRHLLSGVLKAQGKLDEALAAYRDSLASLVPALTLRV